MTHRLGFLTLAALASLLAGCNSARAPQTAAVEPARAPGSANAPLPDGAGCSGAISRYQSLMERDLDMGHVNRSVYDRVQMEIKEAEAACSQGQEARATDLIRASKLRHGYPG
jgi:hypothetical protein